ncbi:MAG TPA: SDR family NAD(P)-dependent oxidoreductase, partial [Stellaceae bacterium]|nr:SDR family NAD(P)-dependent oxidoreductase [Stellaceae bacterium]
MKDVEGKVAFVTGGASGIGLGIAKSLVAAGAKVVLGDLRQDHLDEAIGYFESIQAGRNVHPIRLDVTDRAAMADAADETERRFGRVHILVNNAGVGIEGPLDQASYDDWDFGLGVNLGGVINGVQTFVPRIRKHGEGGHVVSTASLAGICPMPGNFAIYATGKAAVIAFMEALRGDLAPYGVGVSVLCPGPIKSRIHELAMNRPERFKPSEGFGRAAELLGRRQVSDLWMEPERVGEMVLNAIRNDELYIITHGEWREV